MHQKQYLWTIHHSMSTHNRWSNYKWFLSVFQTNQASTISEWITTEAYTYIWVCASSQLSGFQVSWSLTIADNSVLELMWLHWLDNGRRSNRHCLTICQVSLLTKWGVRWLQLWWQHQYKNCVIHSRRRHIPALTSRQWIISVSFERVIGEKIPTEKHMNWMHALVSVLMVNSFKAHTGQVDELVE